MIGKNFRGRGAGGFSAAKNAKNAEKKEKSISRTLLSPIFASFAFFAAKMDLERVRPLPMGGATFQSRPRGWRAGGMREEEIYKNNSNSASRTRTAWRGLEPTLKTMKTASRTGKTAGAQAARYHCSSREASHSSWNSSSCSVPSGIASSSIPCLAMVRPQRRRSISERGAVCRVSMSRAD